MFYKMYFGSIHHFIIRNGGDEQEAKDVYQEGIIVLYEKIREHKLELTSSLKTFLYSICRNLWLKQLVRKERFTGKIEEHQEFIKAIDEDIHEQEVEMNQYAQMKKALDLLGEPCKTLITDFYIKNLNMQEITEKFGYTNAANSKNQKYKCMNRLKRYFFELYKS